MRDGRIFFAIGIMIDSIQDRIRHLKYSVKRCFFSKETKQLQVLAGIRKKEDL